MEEGAALQGTRGLCGPKRVRTPRRRRGPQRSHNLVAASLVEERPTISEECQGRVRTSSCEGARRWGTILFWVVAMWVVVPISACMGCRPPQYTCPYAILWRSGTCGSAGREITTGACTVTSCREYIADGASCRGPAISACIRSSGGSWLRLARGQATGKSGKDQWERMGGDPWSCGDWVTNRRGIYPPRPHPLGETQPPAAPRWRAAVVLYSSFFDLYCGRAVDQHSAGQSIGRT